MREKRKMFNDETDKQEEKKKRNKEEIDKFISDCRNENESLQKQVITLKQKSIKEFFSKSTMKQEDNGQNHEENSRENKSLVIKEKNEEQSLVNKKEETVMES